MLWRGTTTRRRGMHMKPVPQDEQTVPDLPRSKYAPVRAFGEIKRLNEWLRDDRAGVSSATTVISRLRDGVAAEWALMLPKKVFERKTDPWEYLCEHIAPEPNSGCWLWCGPINDHGYGVNKRLGSLHRLSCILFRGPIPKGMGVLHKCDVRCCVNPDHLYVGTHTDNMRDVRVRARRAHLIGEKAAHHKISEEEAKDIWAAAGSQREIAKRHGISQYAIWAIKNGRAWGHLCLEN